jgi:hypothetical protein
MSRDASLTDFDGEEGEPHNEDECEGSGPECSSSSAESADGSDPDPTSEADRSTRQTTSGHEPQERTPALTTTIDVAGEERPCERCGDPTDRRWRDDGALVCLDCKEW